MDIDIKLTEEWKLTAAAAGDAPVVTGFDCIVQNIMEEAATQEGELFYDTGWGWSLYEFINAADDPLTVLEINMRVRSKLEQRELIIPDTVRTDAHFSGDKLYITASFRLEGDDRERTISVAADAVTVEVVEID